MKFPIGFTPKPVIWGSHSGGSDAMEHNWAELQRVAHEAKAEGTLVGRYITHPIADGQAVYQVIKETKHTATIRVVRGLGDDWVLPAWGEQITLPKAQVVRFISQQDALAELFG